MSVDEGTPPPVELEQLSPQFVSMHDIIPMSIAHPLHEGAIQAGPSSNDAKPQLDQNATFAKDAGVMSAAFFEPITAEASVNSPHEFIGNQHSSIVETYPVVQAPSGVTNMYTQPAFQVTTPFVHPQTYMQVQQGTVASPYNGFARQQNPSYAIPQAGHLQLTYGWGATPFQQYRTPSQRAPPYLITPPSEHRVLPPQLYHGLPAPTYGGYGKIDPATFSDTNADAANNAGETYHGLPFMLPQSALVHSAPQQAFQPRPTQEARQNPKNCYCGDMDTTDMVICSSLHHEGASRYHLTCVGMNSMPEEAPWICEACKLTSHTSDETISEHDSTSSQSVNQTPPAKSPKHRGIVAKRAWSDAEDEVAITIMRNLQRPKFDGRVDQLWDEISSAMQRRGFNRSSGAVKNQWNRRLRALSGIDERATPRPDLLATGLLLPKGAKVTKSNRLTKSQIRQQKRVTPSTPRRKNKSARRRWSTQLPIRERNDGDNATEMQAFPSSDTVIGNELGEEFGQEHVENRRVVCDDEAGESEYELEERSDEEED